MNSGESSDKFRIACIYFDFCLLLAIVTIALPQQAAAVQERAAARLINFRGDVRVQFPANDWQQAVTGMILERGTKIQTGEYSRASLLLEDETLIKLNRNTTFIINTVSARAGWNRIRGFFPAAQSTSKTKVRLEKGEAWFLNKNKDADFEVIGFTKF